MQASNLFSNLPVGNYTIRVYDNCGNAVVNSITLTQSYTPVVINFAQVRNTQLTCDTVTLEAAANFSDGNIVYPLTVEFKVYPPNNAPVLLYTQVLQSFSNAVVEQVIPRFDGDHYFDVKITDGCGNTVSNNNNPVNNELFLGIQVFPGCALQLRLNITKVVYPYTLEFIAAPAGFNPNLTYSYHPGPYTISSPSFNNVPDGIYTVKITDACNRTRTTTRNIQNNLVPISSSVTDDGCGTVKIYTNNNFGVYLQTVILVAAPPSYLGNLPLDLSGLIVNIYNGNQIVGSSVVYSGLPPGNYVFQVVDSCGIVHNLDITIPVSVPAMLSVSQFPGCEIGVGTVNANYSGNTNYTIQSAIITAAPSNFPHTLPYNLTDVSNAGFSLADVPEGSYTIQMSSTCGSVQTDTFLIEGYNELNTPLEIQQFCSTFNLKFTHVGNGNNPQYGLQKFDVVSGNWVHPVTGLQIINNQIDASNFYQLLYDQFNINLPFSGRLRIIKAFDRNDSQKCVRGIKEFEISPNPQIESYDVISCANGLSAVVLNAIGIGQLLYRITEKNNQPFLVNNGNNNVFANLEPAIYNFQIEDTCGNIISRQIRIFQSLPLSITPNLCENQASSLSVSNYSFLSYKWWKDGAPNVILSTSNVLGFNPYVSAIHNGVYHVAIIHIGNVASCLNTEISFTVSSSSTPSAGNDYTSAYCANPGIVNLNDYLSGSFSSNGYWVSVTPNTPIVNGVIDVTNLDYGTYVYHYVVNGFCSQNDVAVYTIILAEQPSVPNLLPVYSICEGSTLTIDAEFQNNVEYLWTGPNGFSFNGQTLEISTIAIGSNGEYTLIIKKGNCSQEVSFQVNVSSFPEFRIEEACINNKKALRVVSSDNTFNGQNYTYQWTGPNNYASNEELIYINDEEIGVYTVTVTNSFNCMRSAEINVESLLCEIPKGISPNGDGKNDYFDLSGLDIIRLKIFNRYGTEVYSQEKYKKEWYGQSFNGKLLPTATYYYVVKLASGESKTGWVYLMI